MEKGDVFKLMAGQIVYHNGKPKTIDSITIPRITIRFDEDVRTHDLLSIIDEMDDCPYKAAARMCEDDYIKDGKLR